MTDEGGVESFHTEITRSSRDQGALRAHLQQWLGARLGADAAPEVVSLEGTSANGMSSETLLVEASWAEGGSRRPQRLAVRVAPDDRDVPVFPSYDLGDQFETIRLVGELSDVPVPRVWWYEPDPGVLGKPFFVMERLDGQVPPDIAPYNFGDSWLFKASPDEQRRLQDSTVAAIAGVHGIVDATRRFDFLELAEAGDTPLRRRFEHTRAWYEWVATDFLRSPLLDRVFGWLDEHFPSAEGSARLCWGDSRIGNVIYRDFEPVAILDWEMACLAPRELDVSWLIYSHRVFEDFAVVFEAGGMPNFLRPADVADTYERLTGHQLGDLEWYCTYAAVQYGIVFLRTGQRAVHFGDEEMPDDIDGLIRNGESLEQMLAGTYWNL